MRTGPSTSGALGAPGPSWSGTGEQAPPPPSSPLPEVERAPVEAPRVAVVPPDLAGLGWRAGAFAIDLVTIWVGLIVLSIVFIGDALVGDPEDPAVQETLGSFVMVSWAVQALFYWVCNSIGTSPGKRVLGLRIVTSEGRPPGVMRGFARTIGMLLSFLALGLGHLWAFWNRPRQCWHDKLAGTYVIRPGG